MAASRSSRASIPRQTSNWHWQSLCTVRVSPLRGWCCQGTDPSHTSSVCVSQFLDPKMSHLASTEALGIILCAYTCIARTPTIQMTKGINAILHLTICELRSIQLYSCVIKPQIWILQLVNVDVHLLPGWGKIVRSDFCIKCQICWNLDWNPLWGGSPSQKSRQAVFSG